MVGDTYEKQRMKRFVLRLNQLFNPELYPTEKPVQAKDIYKEFWLELNPTGIRGLTNVFTVIASIFNSSVK